MKKLVALLLAVMMLSAMALAEAPEGYPAVVEGIDFGGASVTIYDYWSGAGERAAEPTEEQQAQYDYRDWLMETYNVVINQKQGGDWNTCAEEMINFVSAPDGSYRVYIIEAGKVGSLVSNGVAAPINYDMTGKKWNAANINLWTVGGTTYGFSTGAQEPRGGLFFNKRVLEEAGIDWNTIYDMQAEGTWTWDVFEDMLIKIQKDVDNDGVVDIWGMTGDNNDLFVMSVATNGGTFFDYDAEGKLQPTMGSEATINGLNWGRHIWQTYFYQQPADGNWDYYKEAWKTGMYGFYMYQSYGGFNDNSEMSGMEDEWGFVAFPVPNAGDNYLTSVSENTYLIPNIYTAEEVEKIMLIVDMWTNATPGYDDEFGWIGNKYNYTDDRAVDETYAMLREGAHGWANRVVLLGTQNDVLGQSLLWSLGGSTPAELIEAGMPAWQAMCDTFNAK